MGDLKNTLTNFIKNLYTRHEYFHVLRGFEKGDEDKAFISELEKQWDELKTEKISGYKQKLVWDKINKQIDTSQLNEKKMAVSVFQFIQRVAAILFLPLFIISIFYYTQNNRVDKNSWAEINCPAGGRIEFWLPDGSTGFLNSKSKLKYPVSFENSRDVYLTGEAYFDVVKNKESRFTVSTEKLKVEVWGTSFNIMAYEDQPNEEITLETGSLKVLTKKNQILSDLIPNQQFILNKAQNYLTKKEVNASNYTSWIFGKLIIQNERFEDVAKRLSRWYDVDILINSQELKDFRYYATFIDEPLDEVLRLIVITAPVQYKVEARIQNKDGSFTKKKIEFSLNKDRIKNFN